LTTVVFALLSRAAPQLNLYTVGFPLRMVVGLLALVLLLPAIVAGFTSVMAYFTGLLAGLA
jgi:flagellar biosynthetic protein FliR